MKSQLIFISIIKKINCSTAVCTKAPPDYRRWLLDALSYATGVLPRGGASFVLLLVRSRENSATPIIFYGSV
jgi:hypothetical protein